MRNPFFRFNGYKVSGERITDDGTPVVDVTFSFEDVSNERRPLELNTTVNTSPGEEVPAMVTCLGDVGLLQHLSRGLMDDGLAVAMMMRPLGECQVERRVVYLHAKRTAAETHAYANKSVLRCVDRGELDHLWLVTTDETGAPRHFLSLGPLGGEK